MNNEGILVSVVMPCLNEEAAIGDCVDTIKAVFNKHAISGEVLVVDNGSTDRSVGIATEKGARVIVQPKRGYGNAYMLGFQEARGKYIVMGDADSTYDFTLIPEFIDKLINEKCDYVTGNRYATKEGLKNMPVVHRLIGNPLLTTLLNMFFKTKFTDVYCGMRAFTKEAYEKIKPVSEGMEFALELGINASLAQLAIGEVPIELKERKGDSKLRTIQDGWRSLRLLLLYCPNKVFFVPGFCFLIFGLLLHMLILFKVVSYDGRVIFQAFSGIFATIASVIGFDIISFGLHVKSFSWARRFDKSSPFLQWLHGIFRLEVGLLCGVVMIVSGAGILVYFILQWINAGFTALENPEYLSLGATLFILGFSAMFSALSLSAMSMKVEDR